MNVTITGATGFVGRRLVGALLDQGHSLHVLGRRRDPSFPAEIKFFEWNADSEPSAESLANVDALIHLAGEPVAKRWTREAKVRIRASRVDGTRHLVNALHKQQHRPQVLVSASAIGIYGSRGDEILTETSAPGQGFLSDVASEWENAAMRAETLGIRVVLLRIGVVLGKGGALAKMLPPFRFGLGGRICSGRQWMSWIHIDDAAGLIRFSMENSNVRGAVNATAPNPVTNSEFTRELGRALHRPALLAVPAFALKLLFGEMAEVILGSQRVIPKTAQEAGFRFEFPGLRLALANILESHS